MSFIFISALLPLRSAAEYFPADLFDDRAGEVVDHRINDAVEIREDNGNLKSCVQLFHRSADLSIVHLVYLEPDDDLSDVTGKEANDEDDHNDYDQAQSLFDFGLVCDLSRSQMPGNTHSAVKNHK